MSDDLTDRLRDVEYCVHGGESPRLADGPDYNLAAAAADRITELEAAIAEHRSLQMNTGSHADYDLWVELKDTDG